MPNAEERALSALAQVNTIGFSEFTAKLIGETVDAIVGATIRQLKSYTELVQELSAGVEAFKSKAVTVESVAQYMKDAFPGPAGETIVAQAQPYDRVLYEEIIARVGKVEGLRDPGDGMEIFTAEDVAAIQSNCSALLSRAAEGSFEQLRIMVQMGYARVVFTNGRVKSKLTFDVESSDASQRCTSDIAQSAMGSSPRMKGGILGAILGVSGSNSYRNIRVRTVNERIVEANRVGGEILGEVEINFATETFPSVSVQAEIKPVSENPQ